MSLPEPATEQARAGWAALTGDPAGAVLALDFDGTLAPIVQRPQDAAPLPGIPDVLAALAERVATLAVVTGRGAADAAGRLGLTADSPVRIAGHYGLERWSAGRLTSPEPAPGVAPARDALRALVAAAPAGVELEDKHQSLVVHTRRAADPAGALAALTGRLEQVAADCGLEPVPGKFVLELRPPGIDKGGVLRELAGGPPARSVLVVGDDLGDLPAFAAVRELRADGVPGLAVASASDEAERLAREADLVVDGPDGVLALLTGLLAALPPA